MEEHTIRLLGTHAEFDACENLQAAVWGFSDREVVPAVELISARKAGGLVAGAFDGRGALAGFVFGIWALDAEGRLYHYSRMVGVHPQCRGLGLARRLKLFQRDFVLERGAGLVRWTFDPLEGENASLNLRRLGATAPEYIEDFYGPKTNPVNRGLPTDRFFVRWRIDSPAVRRRLAAPPPAPDPEALLRLPRAVSSRPLGEEDAAVDAVDPAVEGDAVAVEIPPSIRRLRTDRPDEAAAWRAAVREAARALLARGLEAAEFHSFPGGGRRRSLYVFRPVEDER